MKPLHLLSLFASILATSLPGQDRPEEENERGIDPTRLRLLERSLETTESVRLPLERPMRIRELEGDLSQYRLTDLQGNDLSTRLSPRQVSSDLVVRALPDQQFIIKPKLVQRIPVVADTRIKLPGGVVTPSASDPGPAGAGDPVTPEWLRLTFLASPLPAIWNEEEDAYTTEVTFGLANSDDRASNALLESPITVRFSFEGLAGRAPGALTLAGAGLANEQSFTLSFRPTTPTPVLRVRSSLSDADLELSALPRLKLHASRSEILGFGLETVELTAEQLLPHGQRARHERSVPLA
ncbi:MAG: hypothetical protein ACLFU2_12350, partial [Opitutales bacterium]